MQNTHFNVGINIKCFLCRAVSFAKFRKRAADSIVLRCEHNKKWSLGKQKACRDDDDDDSEHDRLSHVGDDTS